MDHAEGLADRLECLSLDLPGFGATPPLASADYSIPAHAGAVVATIEALFPGQSVHLVGNSMGGAVALQVAARRADLVRTLCLISKSRQRRGMRGIVTGARIRLTSQMRL